MALYSPCTVKISFPIALMPQDLTCVSITGSSSSTTYKVSTFEANSSISFLGSGFTIPSFNTDASGSASFTYWYGIPLVITPIFVSFISTLLIGSVLAASASSRLRFSISTWRSFAFPGIITFLRIFFSYGLSSISLRSFNSTTPWECASLVVVR